MTTPFTVGDKVRVVSGSIYASRGIGAIKEFRPWNRDMPVVVEFNDGVTRPFAEFELEKA